MENMVTMSLKDYDLMKDTINELNSKIERMKIDRVEELKDIFKVAPSYVGAGIFIDISKIIKEIYGEEITVMNKKYRLLKEEITTDIYSVYKEVEKIEEDE